MKASRLYKVSAALLALFAIGHTIGFWQVDPHWGADTVVGGMRSVSFEVQKFNRSYWDFFMGFGLTVTVFLVFATVLAWRFGSMSPEQLAAMTVERWSLAICFVFVAALTWKYFFLAPDILSTVGALTLIGAARASE